MKSQRRDPAHAVPGPTTGQKLRKARDLKILAALDSGVVSQAEIAEFFGLSESRVSRIKSALFGRKKASTEIVLHAPHQQVAPHFGPKTQ